MFFIIMFSLNILMFLKYLYLYNSVAFISGSLSLDNIPYNKLMGQEKKCVLSTLINIVFL